MAHLFSCTILISIKIFPWMFQASEVSSRKTLNNNTERGNIQRFYNRCNKDILLGSTHSTVQHQLVSRSARTVDTKETHGCWTVHHMGLSSISHITLIKMMKMGLLIHFTECPTIMTRREHGYTESCNRLIRQKLSQLYKFRAFTYIKQENPGPIPPDNRLEKTTM